MWREKLVVTSEPRQFFEITTKLNQLLEKSPYDQGMCNIFICHTSASLIVCENADPKVLRDLANFIERLVPYGDPLFEHITEGEDDMPAHVRSVLTTTSLSIPIVDNRLALGTWQGVFLWEHRAHSFKRKMLVSCFD